MSWHPIRLSSVSALTLQVLWLLVSGCSSIEKSDRATSAQVLSTNPVPVEIEDGYVLVRGTLNDHEARLVLDTGSSDVLISPDVSAAAGIGKTAKARFNAFGTGRGSGRQGVVESIAVGPAVANKVPVAIIPMPPIAGADGLLGLSFLREFTFRLDYQQKLLSFASSANSNLIGRGSSVPLYKEGPMLLVQAEVDRIPARLIVDTGGGQALILRSSFVKKHKLRERYPNRLSMVTGTGLLGETHGEIARLQTLTLGDYITTNVFAEFEPDTKTWPGDFAGFVGIPFLRRFNLTFDPTGQRVWLEPNASYAMEPPPPASVRSGLVCLPTGTNWIVQDIIAGSPATEAGVRRGDQLLEINGVSVQTLKFEKIKGAFRAEPGTRVRLRLQAVAEASREVTLILRDLL